MNEMIMEKSCGAVVFTRDDGEIRYIIIHQTNGIYGFPKGHMESGETEEQTALREIKEEVGLDVALIDGFRREDAYKFSLNGEEVIGKKVVYFLGEFSEQVPRPQETELLGVHLLSLDEAIATISFDGMKQILRDADEFVRTLINA